MSYFINGDVCGSPSGTTFSQNLGNIVCMAPKAADPLSVTRNNQAVVGPGPSGVFVKLTHHYRIPYVPTTTGVNLWHS